MAGFDHIFYIEPKNDSYPCPSYVLELGITQLRRGLAVDEDGQGGVLAYY
jgi:hypothetical protein